MKTLGWLLAGLVLLVMPGRVCLRGRGGLHMLRSRPVVVLGAMAIALGGCATIRRHETQGTEQVLSAAGFQMQLGDTPEKLASLRVLPTRRLVPQARDGRLYYVYADPEVCRCLFVGAEPQYQEYQRLALRKRIADEELMAAQNILSASTMNWGLWGPWPWF
jgi:hypothetical protein